MKSTTRTLAIVSFAFSARMVFANCPDFTALTTFTAGGAQPGHLLTADFNGDGKTDLGVLGTSTVAFHLGRGNGTFEIPARVLATGAGPYGFTSGDLNGDGTVDVVTTNTIASTVSIFLGNGDGTWKPATHSVAPASSMTVNIAEVTGDGKNDLVLTRTQRMIAVLAGDGAGGVSSTAIQSPSDGIGVASDTLDANGDGKIDLVFVSLENLTIRTYFGAGDGTFTPGTASPLDMNVVRGLAMGDFDRDGVSDAAVVDGQSGKLAILLGTGGGNFGAPTTYASGNGPWTLATADLTGDHKLDIVVANQFSSDISVFTGYGNGTFAPATHYPAGGLTIGLATADFNGDGKTDIATTDYTGNTARVHRNDGVCVSRRRSVRH